MWGAEGLEYEVDPMQAERLVCKCGLKGNQSMVTSGIRFFAAELQADHKLPAMLKQMPRNGGTTLRMRRYNPLNTATVPLGNSGITPPPQQLTADEFHPEAVSLLADKQLNTRIKRAVRTQ